MHKNHTPATGRADRKLGKRLAFLGLMGAALLLAGCYTEEFEKHNAPLPAALVKQMKKLEVGAYDPIFIRIFKKEAELEVWKKTADGQYTLLKTYEICAWSGDLGPKFQEGDRQAPEGFYTVSPAQMNPNSSFHLAFNLGYPNSVERAQGRTGSFLMVHGACSSAGCYSMEDHQIQEIYALARDAFLGGQERFQVQAFPFRMTAENMALFQTSPYMDFWRTMKEGYEHFELTGVPPKVDSCDRRYIFNARPTQEGSFEAAKPCPAYEVTPRLKAAVDMKLAEDRRREDEIVQGWITPQDRKHAELMARLKIENERVGKFTERGLAYSSREKMRLIAIQKELLALGYNADGTIPATASNTPGTTNPIASALATPAIASPAPSATSQALAQQPALTPLPNPSLPSPRPRPAPETGVTSILKGA